MKAVFPALILMFILSTAAAAEGKNKEHLYLQLDGGTAQFSDGEIDGQYIDFDEGWSANARIGVEEGWAGLEFEAGLHGAPYSPTNGKYSPALFVTLGANLLLKFIKLPGFDAYGSLGAGFLYDDEQPGGIQVHGHVETGVIIGPSRYVQLVPHIRAMAIYGVWEPNEAYTQYLTTARLGLRIPIRP